MSLQEDSVDVVVEASSITPPHDEGFGILSSALPSSVGMRHSKHRCNKDNWNYYFKKLKEFKLTHGDDVEPDSVALPTLAKFVRRQRFLEQRGRLDDAKKAELDSIGFRFEVSSSSSKQKIKRLLPGNKWMLMFRKLESYKIQYGDFNVPPPSEYLEDQAFARWVRCQRRSYSALQKKKPACVRMLDQIGFDWGVGVTDNRSFKKEVRWEKKLILLAEYVEKHGNCNVPENHPQLGNWVKYHRAKYDIMQKKCPKKVEQLNELGFEWQQSGGTATTGTAATTSSDTCLNIEWINMYEKLKSYQREYGNCNVPFPTEYYKDPALAEWVRHQRAQYNQMAQKTPHLVEMLNELGFNWQTDHDDVAKTVKWQNKSQNSCPDKLIQPNELDCDRNVQPSDAEQFLCEDMSKISFHPPTKAQAKNRTKCRKKQAVKAKTGNKKQNHGNHRNANNHKYWQKKFKMLCKYKKDNGHCDVPLDHGQLGRWVKRQRMCYKLMLRKRPGRIKLLNQLGFDWKIQSSCTTPAPNNNSNVSFDVACKEFEKLVI